MTMFNTRGTHQGGSHSALYSATHAHTHSNRGEITLPVTPARQRVLPFLTARILQMHSGLSDTIASRLSRPHTGFFRSTALWVWALSGSCIVMAQDSSSSALADVGEIEEVVVSSRTPDLID